MAGAPEGCVGGAASGAAGELEVPSAVELAGAAVWAAPTAELGGAGDAGGLAGEGMDPGKGPPTWASPPCGLEAKPNTLGGPGGTAACTADVQSKRMKLQAKHGIRRLGSLMLQTANVICRYMSKL